MSINSDKKRYISYCQAIAEAGLQLLAGDKRVFIMGLGVTDYKGIFGTTLDCAKRYGPKRVIETPASENALTGMAIGSALMGKRPIIVHARNDFMFLTLDEMLNSAAKWHYAYGGRSRVGFVVRGIIGKGWGQGPTHSQSIQSVFLHFPGLHVLMPSTPYDAKGMMISAVRSSVPTVILEHRRLYDNIAAVPSAMYEVRPGRARIARRGKDITIVATSLMVQEAVKAHMALRKMGISLEVIDPRSLRPLDEAAILRSVKKTRRAMVADTSWLTCGFAAEVAAIISEKAISSLKAPIKRIGLAPCPAPVSKVLEDEFYPTYKTIFLQACELMGRAPDLKIIEDPIIDTFKGPY